MNYLRAVIRKYFSFTRSETNGFIILIPLTAIIILLPPFYKHHLTSTKTKSDDEAFTKQLVEELNSISSKKEIPVRAEKTTSPSLKPKKFNPNNVTQESLASMGLNTRLIRTLDNYRKKGGRFRIKSDLSRLYGLDNATYEQLFDFIDLPVELPSKRKSVKRPAPLEATTPKDINSAVAQDFSAIRGIGEVLSKRIVSFRSGLGGFYSLDQLEEVYGLNDTVITDLKRNFYLKDSTVIDKIELGHFSEEQLRKHPYISYRLARVIVAYREQHNLNSPEDLLNIKILPDSVYRKLYPYLRVSSDMEQKKGK